MMNHIFRRCNTRRALSLWLPAIILCAAPVLVHAQATEGIRILRSDAQELIVEITPEVELRRTAGGDLLPIIGGLSVLNSEKEGAPLDGRIVLPIGLPSVDGGMLDVLAVEYGESVAGRIAPVPTFERSPGDIPVEVYRVDPQLYAAAGPPAPVAELTYSGVSRGLHVGDIAVAPYRYDASSNTVQIVKRVQLRVRYRGGFNGATTGKTDGFGAVGLLNGTTAVAWAHAPERSSTALFRRSGVAQARAWLRIEVDGEGLYALLPEDFQKAGINPSSVSNVAIYGGGALPLAEHVDSAAANTMRQIPVIVERDGGTISRVLFYGAGTSGWGYASATDTIPRRVLNPYVKRSSYVVAIDGDASRDFSTLPGAGSPTVFPEYGIGRFLFEEDVTNAIAQGNSGIGSGRDWFGSQFVVDAFRSEESKLFMADLAGLDRSYPVSFRVRAAHHARPPRDIGGDTAWFLVDQNGVSLGKGLPLLPTRGDYAAAVATERVYTTAPSVIPSDNKSLLTVRYTNELDATGYLDWYEIHYGRRLTAHDNEITFESPTGSGVAEYRITGFTENDIIGFDVTDPSNPVRIDPVNMGGGEYVFRASLSENPQQRRRYLIAAHGRAKRVAGVATTRFAGLRESNRNADILVITHEDLRAAAEQYAAYRNGGRKYSGTVVTTEEIYTEFSGGELDPTAIRDYIWHAYTSWTTPPKYVILMGDGHYDFRGLASGEKIFVPTFQGRDGNSYNSITSSTYDDYYVWVDGADNVPDVAIGRISIQTEEQGKTVLEKIKQYEKPGSYGLWRDRIILIGDDDVPYGEASGFVEQSELLQRTIIPQWMETRKIYFPAYPTVKTNIREKPAAQRDLIQMINRGALITNFLGHGNAKVWGHEEVLVREETIPQLTNDTMLTLVSAVTCNFGRFDNPSEQAGSELFLTHTQGGAIAVLATTRAVIATENDALMRAYFGHLFLRDTQTLEFVTLGEAMLAAKRKRQGGDNDQKYILFGDPSLRLNLPQDSVTITAINAVNPATEKVTLKSLSLVTVEGDVRDRRGNIRNDFNGIAIVTLYDAESKRTFYDDDFGDNSTSYGPVEERGGLLFQGPAIVENGLFKLTFRIPKDIAFDTSDARLHAYAYNDVEDAAGATENLRVYGSDTAVIADGSGPNILVYLDDRSFRSGDVVTPAPLLIVDLADTSGINASGAGLGHRIEAWIGDDPEPIDLTEYYQSSPTDFREGSAERSLAQLEPGEYRARVRAWDIFNNPSEATAYFRIVGQEQPGELVVTDVVNWPNPMGRETEFTFRHNQTRPLDVAIDVFTATGRKIKSLESKNVTDRFVRVPWDGRDVDGRKIANGVYLYRLRVSFSGLGADEEQQIIEVIEKIAVAQ